MIDKIHNGSIPQLPFRDPPYLVFGLEAGGGYSERRALFPVFIDSPLNVADCFLVGFFYEGEVSQPLIRIHVFHFDDFHRGVQDLVFIIQSEDELGNISAGIPCSADNRSALFLVEYHVVVTNLQNIHFGVVIKNFLSGVAPPFFIKFRVKSHVGGHHDNIRFISYFVDFSCNGNACGFIRMLFNAFLSAIPDGDIGCYHSDDGDLDTVSFDDGVPQSGNIVPFLVLHIGGKHGEFGLLHDGLHRLDSPVELMVTEGHNVIAHIVHGFHHRVLFFRPLIVQIIGHDRTLDSISPVDKE